MNDVVGGIIKEYLELNVDLIERELKLKLVDGKASTVVGVRRSGKTSLLLYYFQRFREENKSVVFFPFDDDRIYLPDLETFKKVIKTSKEIYPDKRIYFFFDEIQEVKNWEIPVKRLVEREEHFVFLTGSSSKLLSKEIATQLRGRTVTQEIYPFSFKEILNLNGIEPARYYTEGEESKIKALLRRYLEYGGFPEIWTKENLVEETLKSYIDVMLYRDLVERFNIRNYKALKLFLKIVVGSFSTRISINKISNYMKTLNIDVSRNTLYNYLEYCNDAYIVYPVKRFSSSLREVEQGKPKIYVVDNGLINVFAHKTSEDMGRLMENLVFMDLRRRYRENEGIFYYTTRGNREVDFLIREGGRIKQLIEVTYDLDDEHIRKMFTALEELRAKNGVIVTWDTIDTIRQGNREVNVIPLWRWLIAK